MAIVVEDPAWSRALPRVRAQARRAARLGAGPGGDKTLTVLLTDDDTIHGLNARFRGGRAATNVLAFPSAPIDAGHLGDVALAYGVCAREADEQGKSLLDHMRHLIVHGVLHLAGHDHEVEAEATAMEGLERRLMARLGVADPYRARDDVELR